MNDHFQLLPAISLSTTTTTTITKTNNINNNNINAKIILQITDLHHFDPELKIFTGPRTTVAIGNATNAGLLAARMLGSFMTQYQNSTLEYMTNSEEVVLKKAEKLETEGYKMYHP